MMLDVHVHIRCAFVHVCVELDAKSVKVLYCIVLCRSSTSIVNGTSYLVWKIISSIKLSGWLM
jgi:hypothetical protein